MSFNSTLYWQVNPSVDATEWHENFPTVVFVMKVTLVSRIRRSWQGAAPLH
jgi:hypothetical protein